MLKPDMLANGRVPMQARLRGRSQAGSCLATVAVPGNAVPIVEFVKLARTIRAELPAIHASLDHGLWNALIESANAKIRLLTRLAFGLKHPPQNPLALLALGDYRPALPIDQQSLFALPDAPSQTARGQYG
ncbi:transposase [Amycolatopsis orientalis]|uniref:transposase n=1 Tax=Amycolatopsis orientalis TaxID=31958 RepID=UPI0011AB7A43